MVEIVLWDTQENKEAPYIEKIVEGVILGPRGTYTEILTSGPPYIPRLQGYRGIINKDRTIRVYTKDGDPIYSISDFRG